MAASSGMLKGMIPRTPLLLGLSLFLATAALSAQDPAPSTIWQSTGSSNYVGLGSKLHAVSDLNQDGVADFLSVAPNGDYAGHARTGVITAISGADGTHLWQYAGWVDHQLVGKYMAYPGDFDGDQMDDFLIGEPEVSSNGHVENGRITALRGSDGTILWQMLGPSDHARLGENMDTLGDINSDGVPDILCAMPLASTGSLYFNGSILVISGAWGSTVWLVNGAASDENLGAQIAVTTDLDGDTLPDILSLASDASSNGLYQNGVASALSAASGTILWRRDGAGSFEHMAQVAKASEDVDGDGVLDLLLRAPSGSSAGFFNNGWVEMVSGATGTMLWHVDGNQHDMNLGSSALKIGDVDLDGIPDFAVSSPGSSGLGMVENGLLEAYSSASGTLLWSTQGSVNYGRFGSGLLALDDVDGDGLGDLLTGLPTASTLGKTDNGYVQAISAMAGGLIWRKDGSFSGEQLGTSVVMVADFSGDGMQDVILGAHNADINGLYDCGEILGVSGANGTNVWSVAGTEAQELLGKDLTTFTDMNGDGHTDLLAFSPFSNTQGLRDNGLVKAFSMTDGSIIWRHDGGHDGDRAGWARVLSFDHDHDGVSDLVLGSGLGDYGAHRGNGAITALSAGRIQTLDIQNLVGGSTATFQGFGFVPGTTVTVFASLLGPGPYEVRSGFVVALTPPLYTLGTAPVDPSGAMSFTLAVPSSVVGQTVWFQAVQDNNGVHSNSNQLQLTVQ